MPTLPITMPFHTKGGDIESKVEQRYHAHLNAKAQIVNASKKRYGPAERRHGFESHLIDPALISRSSLGAVWGHYEDI